MCPGSPIIIRPEPLVIASGAPASSSGVPAQAIQASPSGVVSTAGASGITSVGEGAYSDFPIFSPTQTEDYLRCPAFWYYRQHWKPRSNSNNRDIALLLGKAVDAGLSAYYRDVEQQYIQSPYAAAAQEFDDFDDDDTYTKEGLVTLATKGIKAALAEPLLREGETVLDVQRSIGECRLDLVIRTPASFLNPTGGLRVIDFKVKREQKRDWMDRVRGEFQSSWQLRHNAWAAQEYYGEPVIESAVQLVVLSPRTFAEVIKAPNMGHELIEHWLRSAKETWLDMMFWKAKGVTPPMNTTACMRFGRCDYWDLTHSLHGDQSKAHTLFERIA